MITPKALFLDIQLRRILIPQFEFLTPQPQITINPYYGPVLFGMKQLK